MVSQKLVAASYVPIVLSILDDGQTYGYDLIKQISRLSDQTIRWTPGKLYPLLHDMESEGLLESTWRTASTGRERKYYGITVKGQRSLERAKADWLNVHAVLARLWKLDGGAQPVPA